jgi:hypothetical protein
MKERILRRTDVACPARWLAPCEPGPMYSLTPITSKRSLGFMQWGLRAFLVMTLFGWGMAVIPAQAAVNQSYDPVQKRAQRLSNAERKAAARRLKVAYSHALQHYFLRADGKPKGFDPKGFTGLGHSIGRHEKGVSK